MKSLAVFCLVLLAVARTLCGATAAGKADDASSFDALRAQYASAVSQIEDAKRAKAKEALAVYRNGLDAALAQAQKEGDLDAFLLVQAERERFDSEKTVPAVSGESERAAIDRLAGECSKALVAAGAAQRKSMLAVNRRYETLLGDLVRKLVQAGQIEQAKNVSEELKNVQAKTADVALEPGVAPDASRAEDPRDISRSKRSLPPSLRKGLVLFYSFDQDEGGRVTDGSEMQNDGDVHGATWTAKGKVGGAYDFDGKDDFIELGPTRLYKTTGALSACAWVQPRCEVAILLSNYHGGGAYNGQFFFAYVANVPDTSVHRGLDLVFGQSSGAFLRYLTRSVELPAGKWHHVAFSYDESRGRGQRVKFYVDGVEAAIGLIQGEGNGGAILDTEERLRIMAHRDTPTGTLSNGLVDELMIYNRALAADEVRQIYNAQK